MLKKSYEWGACERSLLLGKNGGNGEPRGDPWALRGPGGFPFLSLSITLISYKITTCTTMGTISCMWGICVYVMHTHLAGNQLLAVLVLVELGNHHLGRADAHVHTLPVGLLTLQALDVNDPLATVNGCHLAGDGLLLGVRAAHHLHLVVPADGETLDAVLGAELLGKRRRHLHATLVGGRREVGLELGD